jgi:heme oxygenase
MLPGEDPSFDPMPSNPLPTPLPTLMPLARALREGTADLHREAERAGLMGELLRGRISRQGYSALLRNLHALYQALEAHLSRHAGDPALAAVWSPELAREAALASDLATLHGSLWEREIQLQPAMTRYVARLDEVAQATPRLLLAHAYVRYLGDLSGGQIVRRVIAASLALGEDRGQAFYRFAEAPERLAARLRTALDAIGLVPHELSQLVDEARLAFGLHIALFEQLAGDAAHSAAVPPPA